MDRSERVGLILWTCEAIRNRLNNKATRSEKEAALLSELNEINRLITIEESTTVSVRLTKMTGPDDGRCGCCGR